MSKKHTQNQSLGAVLMILGLAIMFGWIGGVVLLCLGVFFYLYSPEDKANIEE